MRAASYSAITASIPKTSLPWAVVVSTTPLVSDFTPTPRASSGLGPEGGSDPCVDRPGLVGVWPGPCPVTDGYRFRFPAEDPGCQVAVATGWLARACSVRGAVGAGAEDLQGVGDLDEAVLPGHLRGGLLDARQLDLDRAPTLAADQVMVVA